MSRVFNHRWTSLFVCITAAAAVIIAATAISSDRHAVAAPGGVIVSDQGDCSVGPTNINSLSPGQTAYVWLTLNSTATVRGYTYEITGTNNSFDSGILKIRFNQCRKTNIDDFVAKFTTPTVPGGYTLTVFDASSTRVISHNFTIS